MPRMAPVLDVRFFATAQGREPVRVWLKSLPKDERRAIGEDLKTIQFGWPLGMPLARKMETDLWEARCTISFGIARVLFTVQAREMVLLHGFIKKSRKTPKADLELALRRMREVQHG